MVDGSIASVAEINSLLERNSNSGQPVMLFAKGYFEEVISTLAKNFKLKKLNIVPLIYGESLSSINFAADISAISGCVPISRDFGDTISTSVTHEDKYGKLRNISYSQEKLTAMSDLDYSRYIHNLKIKLSQECHEDKQLILAKRISNLTSETIEIRIPESKNFIYEDCDDFIKTYKNIIESGLVHLDGFGMIPMNCYQAAKEVTNVFKRNIESIGCAICLDKESFSKK